MFDPLEGLDSDQREGVIDHDVAIALQSVFPDLRHLGLDHAEELDAIIRVASELRAALQ